MVLLIRLSKQERPPVMSAQAGIQEVEPVAVLTWIPGSSLGMTKKNMKQPAVYMMASRRNGTLYIGVRSNQVKQIWEPKKGTGRGLHQPIQDSSPGLI